MSIEYDEPLLGDPEQNLPKRGRVKRKPVEKSHKLSLEEALTTLKALGFTINIPTSEEDRTKQDQTSSKLGFITTKVKKPKSLKRLIGTLSAAHRIGTNTYGPGELDLPLDQADLFRSLLQQDQACIRAHMDTSEYTLQARCFFIQPGTSRDSQHKFSKHEVSETIFNSDALMGSPTITAGSIDIAGYNPSVGQETRDF